MTSRHLLLIIVFTVSNIGKDKKQLLTFKNRHLLFKKHAVPSLFLNFKKFLVAFLQLKRADFPNQQARSFYVELELITVFDGI